MYYCVSKKFTLLIEDKQVVGSSTRGNTGGTRYDVDQATDGTTTSQVFGSVYFASTDSEMNPWLRVDLEDIFHVTAVKIYARSDCCGST